MKPRKTKEGLMHSATRVHADKRDQEFDPQWELDQDTCPTCGDPTWRAGWDCDECSSAARKRPSEAS